MKRIIFLLITFATLFVMSCTKDFLDADVQENLTEKRKKELLLLPSMQLELLNAEMRGFYDHIYSYMNSSSRADDERGLTSVYLATDMAGLDIVDGNGAWFRFDYQMVNRNATYRRPAFLWHFFYKMITKSNLMLQEYFVEGQELAPEVKQVHSEIHAIRGMSYFFLVNLFQQTYKGNEDKPGVPLILDPEDEGRTRAKVSEVYAQIIKDLTYAVENSVVTANRQDLDQAVAATYLAKAYAAMEDWTNVLKYAEIAIAGQTLELPNNANMGFANISSPGVLWGYDINAQTTLMYASFFSVFDNTVDGYAPMSPKWVYSNLYDKISDTDKRKGWFAPRDPVQLAAAVTHYGMISGGSLAHVKFHSPTTFDGDYIYLRMEDAYLLKVEAQVKLGQDAAAKQSLSSFMGYRDTKYDVESITNLEEEVRLQRRIELWGEGVSFFDLKRWKLGINRSLPGTNHLVKGSINAGDIYFAYQIPVKEIEQNPDMEQNP